MATGRFPGQPGAENMREIVWDDELAARAQKWAENCDFNHDPHRKIGEFFCFILKLKLDNRLDYRPD